MRLNKLEIAVLQLNHAIELYLKNQELVSVITLAGAAEEILGQLAKSAGYKPSLQRKAESALALHKHLWNKAPDIKLFIDLKNKTKNELKHLVSGSPIDVNIEDEAKKLLDRAVENYKLLHVRRNALVRTYERVRHERWQQEQRKFLIT